MNTEHSCCGGGQGGGCAEPGGEAPGVAFGDGGGCCGGSGTRESGGSPGKEGCCGGACGGNCGCGDDCQCKDEAREELTGGEHAHGGGGCCGGGGKKGQQGKGGCCGGGGGCGTAGSCGCQGAGADSASLGRTFSGSLIGTGLRFALVVSRFNEFITERLLTGALDTFKRHGVSREALDIVWVPGSFEMPLVTKRLAYTGAYQAICCLGAVIRGGTPHFEYVANEVAKGLAQVALESEIPVTFGILTTDNLEQALERAGAKAGNKGAVAALNALEMADLLRQLPKSSCC